MQMLKPNLAQIQIPTTATVISLAPGGAVMKSYNVEFVAAIGERTLSNASSQLLLCRGLSVRLFLWLTQGDTA